MARSPGTAPATMPHGHLRAVLFDRDGTLIEDVPHNRDPDLVRPLPGAVAALRRLRAAGLATAVVTNQGGVGLGLLTPADVERVHARVDRLLGPFACILYCPHAPQAGCDCRKPSPRLLLEAAARLGVPAQACAYVGDIGSDVDAALAAGVRPVLVPTPVTLPDEVSSAPLVAASLEEAVDRLLGEGGPR